MKQKGLVVACALALLVPAVLVSGCGQFDSQTGSGGTQGSGGIAGSGGVSSSGGSTATGGVTQSGGSKGTGGVSASGGVTGSGGSSATGGALGTGGMTGSGGVGGAGGTNATGGVTASGGTKATGGTTAAGGNTGAGGVTQTGGRSGTGGATASGGATGSGGTQGTGGTTASGGATGTGGTTSGGITGTGSLATNCPNAIPAGVVAEWCNCDQWGELHKGDIIYYNDIWGDGAGPQCIWVAGNKWGVASNQPSSSTFVKSYPNISYSPGKAVSAYNTYTSSFDITVPSGGKWEMAYDIWVQNSSKTQVEIMLWVNYTKGSVFPAGSLGKSGVTTGGHTWDVYYGAYGGHDVVSLLRTSNTTSATVDIKAILDWIIANKGNFQSNWTLYQVQFGPEIVADSGVQSFVCNSFSVSST
jgi:hypothetical protein